MFVGLKSWYQVHWANVRSVTDRTAISLPAHIIAGNCCMGYYTYGLWVITFCHGILLAKQKFCL
jgi:hypothetical protein